MCSVCICLCSQIVGIVRSVVVVSLELLVEELGEVGSRRNRRIARKRIWRWNRSYNDDFLLLRDLIFA